MPIAGGGADDAASPIFGVKLPAGYREWQIISVAHEAGSLNDIRAVLGNGIAMKAYREGKRPFPDGAIIARLAWKMCPRKKTTQSSVKPNLSFPDPPQTFNSVSRIRRSTPTRMAGDTANSKMASRIATRL
jgi:hypothetical protein